MSDQVRMTFPDGVVKAFPKGTTTEDIAGAISSGLKKQAVAGKLDGSLIDLHRPIEEDGDRKSVV